MKNIVTLTFSPCVDKSTSVSSFIPEKKMKCGFPKLEPGGGGINVAKALKRLGVQAKTIFPAGGCIGETLSKLVNAEQLSAVIIPSESETRENLIVVDETTREQYRFVMPGKPLQDIEWQHCLDALLAIKDISYIVVSGSLPAGFPPDIFRRLADLAKNVNARLCVDTSGEALKTAAEAGVYLLKPNLAELSMLHGLDKIDLSQIEELSRTLIRKNKCEVMVVSMGGLGAMLITKEQSFKSFAPQVNTVSTSGAGDSMLAGMIFCMAKGDSLEHVLDFGVACGTAATQNPGTELFYVKDVISLMDRVKK